MYNFTLVDYGLRFMKNASVINEYTILFYTLSESIGKGKTTTRRYLKFFPILLTLYYLCDLKNFKCLVPLNFL